MTGQVRESQAEDQKKLALKLYAIDNLQTFYKQNADSFWFRLFFPGRLARALNEDSYNFQEVYQAYFARSRWMRFFFGGYREVSMFTADDTSQKAFSILAKAGDLLVDDKAVNVVPVAVEPQFDPVATWSIQ